MIRPPGPEPAELHEPVMVARIVELLTPALGADGVVVDATLGMGGHAEAMLSAGAGSVIGIDRDPEAMRLATARLAPFGRRFTPLLGNFADAIPDAGAAGSTRIDAFLFDLGVSSLQLDSDDRGFAYSRDTGLDMRMDASGPVTARHIVNEYGPQELERVMREHGGERHARRITRAIEHRRRIAPITTSAELAEIVSSAVPARDRRRGHPAKRVFQALRIEVNDELGALRAGLGAAVHVLPVGGRIAVLSYHSGEDRIVKRAFVRGAHPPLPPGLPVIPPDAEPFLEPLTRGAEIPTVHETARNPRAASARLRAVVKIRPAPPRWSVAR